MEWEKCWWHVRMIDEEILSHKIQLLSCPAENSVPLWAATPPLIERSWRAAGIWPLPIPLFLTLLSFFHSLSIFPSPLGLLSKPLAYPPATDKKVIKLLNGTSVSPFPISAIRSGFGVPENSALLFYETKGAGKRASTGSLVVSRSTVCHSRRQNKQHSQTSQRIFPSPYPPLNGR